MKKIIFFSALVSAFLIINNAHASGQGQLFDPNNVDDLAAIPYDTQITWLKDKAPDKLFLLLTLSNQNLAPNAESEAEKLLAGIEKVIKYQSRLSSIVPTATKTKLLVAMNYFKKAVNEFIAKVKNEAQESNADRVSSLKKVRDRLLNGTEARNIKVGMLDVFTTPTDLKTGLSKLFESLEQRIGNYTSGLAV